MGFHARLTIERPLICLAYLKAAGPLTTNTGHWHGAFNGLTWVKLAHADIEKLFGRR